MSNHTNKLSMRIHILVSFWLTHRKMPVKIVETVQNLPLYTSHDTESNKYTPWQTSQQVHNSIIAKCIGTYSTVSELSYLYHTAPELYLAYYLYQIPEILSLRYYHIIYNYISKLQLTLVTGPSDCGQQQCI